MAKKLKTFRLSPEAQEALKKLAAADDRPETYIIEKLILAAAKKEKIK